MLKVNFLSIFAPKIKLENKILSIFGVKNSYKIILSYSSFNFSAKINIESMYKVGYFWHENSNFFVFVTLDLDSKC